MTLICKISSIATAVKIVIGIYYFSLVAQAFMRSKRQTPRAAARTSPKSKHIHKFNQPKPLSRAPQTRQHQEEVPIYHESSDEQSQRDDYNKIQAEHELLPTLKIESPEEASQSDWEEGESSESPSASIVQREKPNREKEAIIAARSYKRVSQLDFELYCTFLLRTKIYGAMLMSHSGRLLWCDKTSHELLEGSLNNLQKMHITELLLNSQLPRFLKRLESIGSFDERTILQWIVYSKNTKRRYKNVPFPKRPSGPDVFYRFLKALTVRVRPISIELPLYRDPNGFCNQKLFVKGQPKNCFLAEIRLTKRPLNISTINFINDPVIKKFIKKTRSQQACSKRSQKIKKEEERHEPEKASDNKLKTINGTQGQVEGTANKKQRQRAETQPKEEEKTDRQVQSSQKLLQ